MHSISDESHKFTAFLWGLCLAGFLYGCASRSDSDTIEFWAMGVEGEHVEKLLPAFEREYGLQVNVQSIPWTAAHEKLLTAFAGNSMPDIFQLGNTWIPEFQALEALQVLNRSIRASPCIERSSYFEGIWATNFIDTLQYGIPWYVDTRVIFYRRDVLEKIGYREFPKSWSELLPACRSIVRQEETRYALLLPTNEWAGPVILGLQNGSSLLRENNCFGNFSGEKFIQAFQYFNTFYREKLCPIGMTAVTNIYQGFREGFFTLLITGPWNIGEFRRRLPPSFHDKWAAAPLPGPTAQWPGISLAGGSSLVIFKDSPKQEKAWQLLEYLSRPDVQLRFYELTGDLPARREAWQDSSLKQNPYTAVFYRQLQRVKHTPRIPEWEQIALKLQQYVELAAYGKMTPRQAMQQLDREVDIILEKRRWLLGVSR